MTPQKRSRLVAAVTVAIVLLLVILVAVMIYQLVTIFVLKDKLSDGEEEYNAIITEIENMEKDIKYYQSLEGVWDLLIDYGLYNK